MPVDGGRSTVCKTSFRAGGAAAHRSPATVLALVGFTPYWLLLRRPALFYSLAGHDETAILATGWYLVHLAAVTLFVLGAVALARSGSKWVERAGGRGVEGGLFALFAAQAFLKVLEVAADVSGVLGFAVALLDTVLYAFVVVALTYTWAGWCVAVSARRAALVAIGSFALSFFVKLLGLLPGFASTVASALLPLASLVCWRCAVAREACGGISAICGRWDSRGIGAIEGPTRRMIGVLVAFLIAGGAFRGIAFGMVSGESIDPAFSLQDAISVSVAVLVLVYYLAHSSTLRLPWFIMPLSVIVFFAGLLLMMVFADDQPAIGGSIVVVGRTSLGLVFWIVLVDVARSQRLSIVRVFGVLFVLVDVVSSLSGYVIVPLAVSLMDFSLDNATAVFASVVAFALMVVSVMLLGQSLVATLGATGEAVAVVGEGPGGCGDAGGGRDTGGAAPGEGPRRGWLDAYGLTDRETMVADLLAEGNSQRIIANRLQVSIGTVQTHAKNVYRKLGIHSKQELIDLAHGARDERGAP